MPSRPTPNQILTELGHAREDERDEREERRGLETRASALLAAGAAVVGLVATAVQNVNVHGTDRDVLDVGILVASAVMVFAFILIVRALNVPVTNPGPDARHDVGPHTLDDVRRQSTVVEEIREKNLDRLQRLKQAAWVFAFSVTVFVVALVYAAFASSPPPRSNVNVVVHYPPAKVGTSTSCTFSGGVYTALFRERHPTETVRMSPTVPLRLTCVTPGH